MKVRLLACLVLLGSLPMLASDAGVPLSSNNGGFKVMLPHAAKVGKPATQLVDTPVGKLKYTMFMADMGRSACGVGYNDYPSAKVRKADKHVLFGELRDNCVHSLHGKLQTEGGWSLDGHPGLAFRFTAPTASGPIYARTSLLLVGNRLYQIQFYSHTAADLDAPETRRFFHSFELLP